MKSLRCTTCMLSTVEYQSTITGMLDERSTKCANSDGAMGLDSRVRDCRTVSMAGLQKLLAVYAPARQCKSGSLDLDAGVIDHLLPVGEVGLLALGESLGRRADGIEAQRLPLLHRLGLLQHLVDVGRQLVDDRLGRPGRCEDAVPAFDGEIGEARLLHGRQVGRRG